jgi:uncharacterized cupredoxin-like copper-binding protein
MGRRTLGRGPLVVLVAAILLLGLWGYGETRAQTDSNVVDAAGSNTVAVTAVSGFRFTPNGFNDVATGTTVSVSFTDADDQPHTFSILNRSGVQIPNGFSSGQLDTWFSTYGHLVSIQQNTTATAPTVTFTSPGVGWYEFVCLEPGHFQEGMYGFIAFGEPLPSNLTVTSGSTGAGAAVFIIVGTIVSLTVIAIVLGFVVGRRRGSEDEMPPERLGYPEPPSRADAPLPAEPAPPPKT